MRGHQASLEKRANPEILERRDPLACQVAGDSKVRGNRRGAVGGLGASKRVPRD